ncbi:PD-(D/E)XK nuclease family protein [Schwartzia succinivorans]|jgi:ATP-dependent helicase/nuclease subunit B|uniref:ATP-dependent helicase/nuclease subunit B n=1 Tax=Schwartzia succinivorans DSM 10502 TaxID=1123243 RepID=A0A1M4VAP3_9FIRM|nr:PD-(D/E)XK nuclease family protein [Schwartzia succinivorans]SHE65868.1 ATP-dependent helicase/nuclease subunit B [Schwartzia succinivorans DSM 10502]
MADYIDCILGRSGTGKTHECYEEIRKRIEAEPLGKPLILLVPEHRTYAAEKELLEHLTSKSDMRTTVTGFRRLAWRVLKDRKNALLPGISRLGKRLLLKKILLRREKELEVLGRAAAQRRFTEPLEALFEEFKSYDVSPESLRSAGRDDEDSIFSQKLEEIALLYEEYLKETQGKYQDSDDRMKELACAVSGSSLFEGAEVWIDGFLFFNPNERIVLGEIFRTAKEVHITFALDRDIPFRTEIPASELFYRLAGTLQSVKEIAAGLKIPFKVRVLKESRRFKSRGLNIIEQRLFDYGTYKPENGDGVKLTEAATRRLEAEAAVADIVKQCRERGWRWNDFGILLRDEENYLNIVEELLTDYDVPFYTDWKRAAVHHPLAELIRSALESVTQGWRYETVFRYVKTGLLPLSPDNADELENYVLASGIRGEKAWGTVWTYRRKRAGENEDTGIEILERINKEREAVYTALHEFSEELRGAECVRELVRAVYGLLERLRVRESLSSWAVEAEKNGDLDEAEEHRRIWVSVMELLDELVTITGDEKLKPEEFSDIVCDGLDTMEIALVPPGNDAVTIASFDQNSIDNIKAVYILGANEGVMPRRSAEKGILTDADRSRIEVVTSGKIELAPSRTQESANENYLLYHGFTEAREYLWVSWALSDSEGSGLNRAAVVRKLHSILLNPIDTIPLEGADCRDEFQFTQPKRSVGRLASALRSYFSDDNGNQDWTSVYNWAAEHDPERLSLLCRGAVARAGDEAIPPKLAARIFAAQKRMEGSVSQFETFGQCPFKYFAQYGLHLEERNEFSFRALDYGNLMHNIMCSFGERLSRENKSWGSVTPDEQKQICHELMMAEAPMVQNEILYSTEQYKNVMARIEETLQESIARAVGFAKASSFQPRMFEKSFGRTAQEGSVITYPLSNDITLDIKGKIDRIDVGELQNQETGENEPYYLVIDYKTGNAGLSMLDVYTGLRLQLLTYVMAAGRILAANGEKRRPAGLFYCYLKNPVIEMKNRGDTVKAMDELAEKLRCYGWVLETPELIKAIDNSNKYLCVTLKSDGSLGKGKNNVKTEDNLKVILDYTEACLKNTAESILGGEIRVRPYKHKSENACKYCSYKAVCGFDVKIGNSWHIIEDMENEEILEKMKKLGKKGEAVEND